MPQNTTFIRLQNSLVACERVPQQLNSLGKSSFLQEVGALAPTLTTCSQRASAPEGSFFLVLLHFSAASTARNGCATGKEAAACDLLRQGLTGEIWMASGQPFRYSAIQLIKLAGEEMVRAGDGYETILAEQRSDK